MAADARKQDAPQRGHSTSGSTSTSASSSANEESAGSGSAREFLSELRRRVARSEHCPQFMNVTRTKPLRVTWQTNEELRCALFAGLGFDTAMISAYTGLTPGQVNYRLHKAGIKRSDYRHGESAIAQRIIHYAIPAYTDAQLRRVLHLKTAKQLPATIAP